MPTPPRTSLLALLVTLFLSACASTNKEPDPSWQAARIQAPSDRVLWKISLQSLQRLGFPLGAGLDPGSMHAESGWKVDLHPFRGNGQRTMAVVRMTPLERGVWKVEARVKRQTNQELARPLDPRYADWEWEPDDPETALVFLQHVRSALGASLAPSNEVDDPIEEWLRKREGSEP